MKKKVIKPLKNKNTNSPALLGQMDKFLKEPRMLIGAVAAILVIVLLAVIVGKKGDVAGDFVSPKEKARVAAFQQLSRMDSKTKQGVSMRLVPYLKNNEVSVRYLALDAIGSMREDASGTVDALVKVLREDKDPGVQEKAGRTLGYIGAPAMAAVPVLLGGLKDPAVGVRSGSAAGLAGIAPNQPEVVPALIAALSDPNPQVRANVTGALLAQGEKARPATKHLLECLKDNSDQVRANAAASLGKIKVDAKTALAPLSMLLVSDISPNVRLEAMNAIGEMGPSAVKAITPLRVLLRDGNPTLRSTAAAVLGMIGPQSAPAVPDIIKLLDDPEKWVGQKAAEALTKIGGSTAVNAVEQYNSKKKL